MTNPILPEPFVGRPDQSRKMALYVLNVVKFRSKRVLHIDDYDFPVGLALINESHDAEDLDLLHLANITNLLANLADIERVIVASGFGLCMR
jgi:hypothetical protein